MHLSCFSFVLITEAEYAFMKRKDIVPVRVQHRYNADGWLGILVGTKLYFDFTRSDSFDMMMSNLIRELGCRGRSSAIEYKEGNVVWRDSFNSSCVMLVSLYHFTDPC